MENLQTFPPYFFQKIPLTYFFSFLGIALQLVY